MASRADRKLFEGIEPQFLECRDFGHPWGKVGDQPNGLGGWDEHFRCSRCGTVRIRVLNRQGFIVGNSYPEHPDGYSITGRGHIDSSMRAVMRLVRQGY